MKLLKNRVRQNTLFDKVTGTNHHVGNLYYTYPVSWQEEKK